jgi:hypothetical protein
MRMKVKGLNKSKKLYWDYDVFQWYVYHCENKADLCKSLKDSVIGNGDSLWDPDRNPDHKTRRERALLSWFISTHTKQYTCSFEFQVWYEPGHGHFVVAEPAVEIGSEDQFGPRNLINQFYTYTNNKWSVWERTDTAEFIECCNSEEEAAMRAWELDDFKEE